MESTSPTQPTDLSRAGQRRVPFAGITNLRDLGGYPVAGGGSTRWGLVYRSDALFKLTDEDLVVFSTLGIRTVYDLRSEVERAKMPTPVPTVHLSIVGRSASDEATTQRSPEMSFADGETTLRDMYVGILEHSATKVGSILADLARTDAGPALFHCHGGKDRTGVVAAILLLTLGVDEETVLDDYELTSRYRQVEHQQDSLAHMLDSGLSPEAAAAFLGTPRWAMAAAVSAITNTYGGINSFLTGPAGLVNDQLSALRNRLVDSSADPVVHAG